MTLQQAKDEITGRIKEINEELIQTREDFKMETAIEFAEHYAYKHQKLKARKDELRQLRRKLTLHQLYEEDE